jgi:hypothetical protein
MHAGIIFSLLLLCAFWGPRQIHAKGAGSHADRQAHRKRGACEQAECSHLHFLENSNCVNQCVSRACFDEVYKGKELEDGEINLPQEHRFKSCIRKETIHGKH